jgi:single-strand DNA-binding protein
MNVLTITGNLGKDAEIKSFSGSTVCNFTVANKVGFGDKEQTIWFDCALWGKQAESKLPEYLKKGQQVAVSGELSTFESDKGKTYLKLRCNSVDLVGGKSDSVPQQNNNPAPQQAPAPQNNPTEPKFDDDVPF